MTREKTIFVGLALACAVLAGILIRGMDDVVTRIDAQGDGEAAAPTGPLTFETFREIAAAQSSMVVNIRTEARRQTQDLSQLFPGDGLFDRFFGFPQLPSGPRDEITEGAGTGFIIDRNGLILTNNHVVAGATRIAVGLYASESGEEYEARAVGRDPLTDSALIELKETPDGSLPVATLGRSAGVQPGDWVMAIGNPFNLAHTVTVGVISAIGRPFPVSEGRWQEVLQTDAAINPGNSGGPLLNMRGEVVGINTAILSNGPSIGSLGVGFAIPIDAVSALLPELRRGEVTRGRIGVQIAPVTERLASPLGLDEAEGALVRVVEAEGPAAEAGVEPGDVIVQYNGNEVEDSDELVQMVSRTRPGSTVPIEVVRDGRRRTLRVTVAPLELDDVEAESAAASDTDLGVTLRSVTPGVRRQLGLPTQRSGALVTSVEPSGPAAGAGIRAGDVILEVNRQAVSGATDAAAALRSTDSGDTLLLLLWREGQEIFTTMSKPSSSKER